MNTVDQLQAQRPTGAFAYVLCVSFSVCDRKLFNLLEVATFIHENIYRGRSLSHDLHKIRK